MEFRLRSVEQHRPEVTEPMLLLESTEEHKLKKPMKIVLKILHRKSTSNKMSDVPVVAK